MPRFSAKQAGGPGLNALLYVEIQQLRRWVASFPRRPSQKETMAWIEKKFDKKIAQYSISRYLSSRYAHVDAVPLGDASLQATRPRVGQWPTLERMLYQWHQAQPPGSKSTANELLQAKALEIWTQHQEAREGEPSTTPRPVLGASWVRMFKERHGLKRRNSRGKPFVMATAATEGDATTATLEENDDTANCPEATPEAESDGEDGEDAEEPAEAEYVTNKVTLVRHVVETPTAAPPTASNNSQTNKPIAAADDGDAPAPSSPLALSAGVSKLAELIRFVQASRDTDKEDLLLLQSLGNKWDALVALERARARQREATEFFQRLHSAQ